MTEPINVPAPVVYPTEILPGYKLDWDADTGQFIATPLDPRAPQSYLLEGLSRVDQTGYTEYFGYYDSARKPHITKIDRTPPPKGFRMVRVEGPIDPSMGQGAGFWSMEPDLPPDTSLQVELDKALRSGNTERVAELQVALKTYQQIINSMTPYEQNQIERQKRIDAAAKQQASDEQKRWELSQASTDAERRAIEERFNTDQLRLKAAENRRQLEWEADFGATQIERDAAHQRWETEFGNGQYEFGATLGQRQLEFGTEMAQRQWESGQTAQREALKLGLQIQQSPGDWWAYQKLLRGNQPNRPYTGEQAIPRTWTDPWMQFANQPMPTIPQPTAPSLGPPALPARPERQLPPVMGQAATRDEAPGESDWEKYQAAKAAAKPFIKREPTPEEWAAAGLPPPPGSTFGTGVPVPTPTATGGGTNNAPFVGADEPFLNTAGTPSVAATSPTDTRIEMQNEEGTTVFALPEEEEALTGEGFIKKKTGTLLDWASPWLSQLPQTGLRQALFGQPVSRARQLPTLGGPTFPSAQSWTRLLPSEQEMFRGEVRTLGLPEQDYWAQWNQLQPSWGTPGRFRRAPTTMGFTGG